jgi:hypothetical protein
MSITSLTSRLVPLSELAVIFGNQSNASANTSDTSQTTDRRSPQIQSAPQVGGLVNSQV